MPHHTISEYPGAGSGDFAMQKYLLLHNQHEELCQQLHDLCPSYTNSSTAVTSPSGSPSRAFDTTPSPPTLRHHSSSSSSSSSSTSSRSRRRSSPSASFKCGYSGPLSTLAPVLDETLIVEMAAGEQKLFDVNEGIKRALTELLNCERVRSDQAMRSWVQSRLMETEKELRSGRRRRSA
ncbi:uncharacterized protein B0I36DRAFT_148415 [Microdochium trichocladiopsis]|uniref:Uncharacterized protein n=1 Tax=Microdochium trichocladiopsis TaxID=1682393 RepID=A0A9P9BJM1_9PEZI|nr:uncharacterized protein B0I36DRAFT_148415 [Microdochium trichocladiopsis]KAH7025719.1 hypothetical protein B0I36DRAFT_148415 [Microdochium trichocladiopsis]